MKIKVLHDVCGREIFVQQLLESDGHCPWDGKPLSPDYTANLVEALGAAERAGTALESALDRAAAMSADIAIDHDSVTKSLEQQLDRFGRRRVVARR